MSFDLNSTKKYKNEVLKFPSDKITLNISGKDHRNIKPIFSVLNAVVDKGMTGDLDDMIANVSFFSVGENGTIDEYWKMYQELPLKDYIEARGEFLFGRLKRPLFREDRVIKNKT